MYQSSPDIPGATPPLTQFVKQQTFNFSDKQQPVVHQWSTQTKYIIDVTFGFYRLQNVGKNHADFNQFILKH